MHELNRKGLQSEYSTNVWCLALVDERIALEVSAMKNEIPFLKFGRDICGDYESATAREWLVTNGIGGYLSLMVYRGYHPPLFLFVFAAAASPPSLHVFFLSAGLDAHDVWRWY